MKAKYKKVERIRIARGLGYKEIAKEMDLSTTGIFNVLSGLVKTPYATTDYKIDQWLIKWEWILKPVKKGKDNERS